MEIQDDAIYSPSPDELSKDNQTDEKTQKKRRVKSIISSIIVLIPLLIFILVFLELFAIFYFVFCGISSIIINLFICDWLSLFTKKSYHIFLSIISCLSDFGLFFILAIFLIFLINVYFALFKKLKNFFFAILHDLKNQMDKDDEDDCKTFSLELLIAFGITIIASEFFFYFSSFYTNGYFM